MRNAVIDLGSNTFHLLVADVDSVGVRRELIDHKIALRFDPARPGEAHSALDELIARCGSSIHACRIVATGVFRDHGAFSRTHRGAQDWGSTASTARKRRG